MNLGGWYTDTTMSQSRTDSPYATRGWESRTKKPKLWIGASQLE
jgi:hypothetical protein